MNGRPLRWGVPVYSIFMGKIGAVDTYLAERGRLALLKSIDDVRSKIRAVKRVKERQATLGNGVALKQIVDGIKQVIERSVTLAQKLELFPASEVL